jgi:hypothetical protein
VWDELQIGKMVSSPDIIFVKAPKGGDEVAGSSAELKAERRTWRGRGARCLRRVQSTEYTLAFSGKAASHVPTISAIRWSATRNLIGGRHPLTSGGCP